MATEPLGALLQDKATPAPYGLVVSAHVVTDGSDLEQGRDREVRWIRGFAFDPESCAVDGTLVDNCNDTTDDPTPNADPADVSYQPFALEAMVKYQTFARPQPDAQARAARKLAAQRSWLLERELWSGTKAIAVSAPNNYLVKAPTLLNNLGSAFGFVDGLAQLEQGIAAASSWERGMIHCTPALATLWSGENLIHKEGNLLVTNLGTIIVPGRGYPGTGPGGNVNAKHFQWAFATGPITVRFGQVTFGGTDDDTMAGVNRTTNERKVRAYQFAAATWSGCIDAGAFIDLSKDLQVPGS